MALELQSLDFDEPVETRHTLPARRDPVAFVVRLALAIYLIPAFLAVAVVGGLFMACSAVVRGVERFASWLIARAHA